MADHNGSGNGVATAEAVTAAQSDPWSSDGAMGAGPETAMDRPELLIGAALLGGVLLAAIVSRIGS